MALYTRILVRIMVGTVRILPKGRHDGREAVNINLANKEGSKEGSLPD